MIASENNINTLENNSVEDEVEILELDDYNSTTENEIQNE